MKGSEDQEQNRHLHPARRDRIMLFLLRLLRTMLLVPWQRQQGPQASQRRYCRTHLFPRRHQMRLKHLDPHPVLLFEILTTLICSQVLDLTLRLHLGAARLL